MSLIYIRGQAWRYPTWQESPPPEPFLAVILRCSDCNKRTWLPPYTPLEVVELVAGEHGGMHTVEEAEAIIREASTP